MTYSNVGKRIMRSLSRASVIVIALIMVAVAPASVPLNVQAAGSTDPPTSIDGNADLAAQAALNGWPGDGSEEDPYIISGLTISTESPQAGISIRNTAAFLHITDCALSGGASDGNVDYDFSGILLINVINARVSAVEVSGYDSGILLDECRRVRVDNSTMSDSSAYGLHVQSSTRLTVENNTVTGSGIYGMGFRGIVDSLIQCNNASYNGANGIDLDLLPHSTGNIIRWNLASCNGDYQGGSALYIAGFDNMLYGNVLVGAGGRNSMPAKCGNGFSNHWNSSDGIGNYYGVNYDRWTGKYGNITGSPVAASADENGDRISDVPYVIPSGTTAEADNFPLLSPVLPPKDLRAEVGSGIVTLSWEGPRYTTSPVGHYVVDADDGISVSEHAVSGTSFTDTVEDPDSWVSITYTVRWVGKFLSSGPSNEVVARSPDHPVVELSGLGGSGSLDPRSVLIEWVGFDSDSDAMTYSLKLDDGLWEDLGQATSRTFNGLAEGEHTVTVRAVDNDGNQVEDSRTFYVYQHVQMSMSLSPYVKDGKDRLLVTGDVWDAASGEPMSGLSIGLAYSVDGGERWSTHIVASGADGGFQRNFPLEKGVVMGVTLIAELEDRKGVAHTFFANVTYAAMTVQGREGVFLTQSTSTLSGYTYTSTMLRFTITGDDGTPGSTSVLIPRSAMGGVDGVKITLDGVPVDPAVSSGDEYWILTLNHTHSAHQVVVEMPATGIFGTVPNPMLLVVLAMIGVSAAVGTGIFLLKRRRA